MNSTTQSSTLLFILCLCLIPLPTLCGNLYKTLCNEAKEDANNCLNLLKSNSRIISSTNYLDLSKYILEMAIDKATRAQNFIIKVTNEHPTQSIRQCATEFYYETIESFRSSLSKLVMDPQNANDDAKHASDGLASCDL